MDRQGKDPFELLEDIENVLRSDAGGIGLFRSEFLYMEMGSKLPSEGAALSKFINWQQSLWEPTVLLSESQILAVTRW